jgi:hypothetical protein
MLATCFTLVSYVYYSSSIQMEATYSPETSIDFRQTTLRYNQELFHNNIMGLSRWEMSQSCTTEYIRRIDRNSLNDFLNALRFVINSAMTAPFEEKRVLCVCVSYIHCSARSWLSHTEAIVRRQGLPQYSRTKVTQSAWPWKLGHDLMRSLMYLFIRWPPEVWVIWLKFRTLTPLCK